LQALGIRETSAAPATKTLIQVLHTERVLLVLDNFEQLLSAAPELCEVLENTEHVKMLVTSRAGLHVRGESEFRVVPLALPDLAHLPPIATLQEYAAISLFVKRAQAYRSEFMLTEDNARAVAAICARLDGLPLALELAAAGTNILEPEELLRRLESRLTLLTNGTRDSNVRQQTLRNTIAWSYTLLSTEQQQLFRRLAVLAGGISVAAAGALAKVDVEGDLRVSNTLFQTLASLADQSLLSTAASPGDREPRFMMLETIREYALQLVSEHAELEHAQRVHADYFLRFSESSDARFATEPTIAWLQAFQLEYENIRTALHYFIDEANDIQRGARLVASLGRYWFERGLFHEGRQWLERVRRGSPDIETATDAKILLYLAFVANYESDYRAGAIAAGHARDAYTKSGDRIGVAQANNALGIAAMYTGRYDEAEVFFDGALATYRELGDDRGVAVALHNLGEIAFECRLDFATAESRYEQSLAIFRRLGHSMNVGSTLGVLADMRAHSGDIATARDISHEALATFRRIDNQPLIAEELTRLARYELSTGRADEARSLLRGAVEHLKMSFHARHIARCFEPFRASRCWFKRSPRPHISWGSARRCGTNTCSHACRHGSGITKKWFGRSAPAYRPTNLPRTSNGAKSSTSTMRSRKRPNLGSGRFECYIPFLCIPPDIILAPMLSASDLHMETMFDCGADIAPAPAAASSPIALFALFAPPGFIIAIFALLSTINVFFDLSTMTFGSPGLQRAFAPTCRTPFIVPVDCAEAVPNATIGRVAAMAAIDNNFMLNVSPAMRAQT